MNNIRWLACLGFALAAGCSSSDNTTTDATLRVQNSSDFDIVELHVAPVGTTTWGPNLIVGDTLAPGDSLTVGVVCDTYDVRLVDDSGVPCELNDLDLCLNDADFIIHNNTCTVFGASEAPREGTRNPSGTTSHDTGAK